MEQTNFPKRQDDSPLGMLRQEHSMQLELCHALEHIADGLPESVDRRLAKSAAVVLECGLSHYVQFEDEKLFPLVRRRGGDTIADALQQLQHEHVRDEAFAMEIAEELDGLCASQTCRNPEMLGYMLRGFFEGRRRHIVWENTVVIPVARKVLSPADMSELGDWLSSMSWQHASNRWRHMLGDNSAEA